MKMFYNKSKYGLVLMVVLALVLQVVGPMISEYVYADEGEKNVEVDVGNVEDPNGSNEEDGKDPESEGDITSEESVDADIEATEDDDATDSQEGEKKLGEEETKSEDNDEESEDKENGSDENGSKPLSEAKDLGNIFTLKSLKVNGDEASGNMVVTIADGTTVNLDYTWDTIGKDAKSGDWAEIEIPDTFKLGKIFDAEAIKLNDGTVVGTYSLKDNKIRFEFNDEIERVGDVTNGTLGFEVKFNEEKFKTDVVEEIEFNDKGDKTITVIGKPTQKVESIAKKGTPNSIKDAKEITWFIDVSNPSNTEILNAKVKDSLPEGLEIVQSSVKVNNLNVGLDGKLSLGEVVTVIPVIDGQKLEVDFDNIAPYKGYRIEYTTKITDLSKTEFTNNAYLVANDKELPAKATVDVERSAGIEKNGKKVANKDEIEWWIDVNKSGGSINEAIIEDEFPTGTTLVTGSIEIVKITKGTNDKWTESVSDKTATEFPVNLGKIESTDAYRIKFKTTIDYSKVNDGNYIKVNEFKNKTILKDGTVEVGKADKTVKVTRKPILAKKGKAEVDYENKQIKWTVTVNEANHTIKNAVVTDILPKGLSISKDDIKVFDSGNKDVTEKIKITVPANNGSAPTTIEIDFLGDIDGKYTIEYTTKITDLTIDKFENKASLGGEGVGTGGTIPAVPVDPPKNFYEKEFSGIDYNEKTMEWTITVEPIREAIRELEFIDTFPNKGLILLKDTLVVKKGDQVLKEGYGYTVTAHNEGTDTGYHKGFTINLMINGFIEDNFLLNEKLTITYKTSYDPEKGIDPNIGNGLYKNRASFKGKTENYHEIDETKDAEKQVNTETVNTGKKLGKLISIGEDGKPVDGWVSGNERKIEWEIYTNYLKQNLGSGVTVSDVLAYDGEVDIDSIEVRKYNVEADGKTSLGEVVSDYTVTPSKDNKEFTLSFNSAVKERYAIIFTTSVPDISQKVYTNTATTKTANGGYLYTGSVEFGEAGKEITKNSMGTGDKVYTDDEVKWNIQINKSLSTIQKDVKIVDTISKGLVYKNDSLKVYKLKGTEKVPVGIDQYSLNVSVNETGETVLTILFNNTISSTYEIEYTTVVTATDGTVNNKVEYSGKNLETKSVETTKLNASQFSYVGGDPSKGKIIINKVDSEGEKITAEAEFEVYYMLNGEEQLVGGQTYKTKDGKVEIGNLRLNRTYYIREISAPEGFKFDSNDHPIEVEVTKAAGKDDSGAYTKDVKNDNIKTEVTGTKRWVNKLGQNPPKNNPTIKLQLFRNGEEFGDSVELANGETEYTWKYLNLTDNAGKEYKYTVDEVNTPEGYIKTISEDGLTVTNTKKTGSIEFKKIANNGRELKGATFGLFNKSDEDFKNPVQTVISGEDGMVIFEGVEYGEYNLKEIKAPSGYYPSREVVEVEIIEDGQKIDNIEDVINNRIPSTPGRDSLELIKLGENGEVLAGAVFELVQNGEVKYTSNPTGTDGRVLFENIAYGTYTVREKIAPEGHNLGLETQEITITTGGEVKRLEFKNTKIRGNIEILKQDSDGNPLQGAEFGLYLKTDLEFKYSIKTAISSEDGKVVFKDVEYGVYTIKEIGAPVGYIPSDVVINVEIIEDGKVVIPTPNIIVNEKEDPEDPDKPTDPTEPTDPTDPDKPTDPTEPVGPDDPTTPGKPTDPGKPMTPGKPTKPTDPSKLGRPTYNDGGLVQTGTDINMLIPLGLIIMLIGAAYIFKDKLIRRKF